MKTDKNELWRRMGMLLCFISVLGFTACDDDDDDFDDLNTLNEESFFTEMNESTFFEDADMNNDNFFDEDEFNEVAFNMWDINDNGVIDQSELTIASNDFRTTNMNFSTMDMDGNGTINVQEFQAGFEPNNFFTNFDADTNDMLAEREFTNGVFRQLDRDGDGLMSRSDFDMFNERFFGI